MLAPRSLPSQQHDEGRGSHSWQSQRQRKADQAPAPVRNPHQPAPQSNRRASLHHPPKACSSPAHPQEEPKHRTGCCSPKASSPPQPVPAALQLPCPKRREEPLRAQLRGPVLRAGCNAPRLEARHTPGWTGQSKALLFQLIRAPPSWENHGRGGGREGYQHDQAPVQ